MNTPTFEIRTIDDCRISIVEYDDGSMFTTGDWQGPQPQSPDEIEDFEWYQVDPADPGNTSRWRLAVMLLGYPRML